MERKRAKVIIDGRVQGVSYRYYAQDKANQLGLAGFIRNLPDGRVEAVFEGEEDKVEAMLTWCQTGSPASRVDSIALRYEDPQGQTGGFHVRH